MTQLDYLFAHCSDAVCVAEEFSVSFFAPKTLKKFRVENFSGSRICGLHIQQTRKGNMLHVIDADLHWYVMSLKKIVMEHSTQLVLKKNKHHASGAMMVQFFEVEDHLYSVIFSEKGLFEVNLCQGGVINRKTESRFLMNTSSNNGSPADILFSVGRRSGLVVVGKKGSTTIDISCFEERNGSISAQKTSYPVHQRVLPVEPHSLACSPIGERVAVGGSRGELSVYSSILNAHYFSDHWHHTPISALCFSVDGSSLVTGAQEDVLLVWSMSSYSHRKIRKDGLGPVRCIVASTTVGSTLLVASAFSTLSTVDLLQMSVEHSVEGIEWASGESCTGCFFSQWMGQSVAVLTGLPNVLRLTDPLSQQSVYSLHVSSQMETLPTPPRHGIEFAGILNEGKTIITYELFGSTVLPPQLCFWSYEPATRRHVLVQTVYSPHDEDLLALRVDDANGRLFTLSAEMMKCWEEVVEDPNDAVAVGLHRSWRNQSASPTPSRCVQSMVLSRDGTLCFVADDSVHAFDVRTCLPGVSWPCVALFSQQLTRSALLDLVVLEEEKCVCGRTSSEVFAWSLAAPQGSAPHQFQAPSSNDITAMCRLKRNNLLVALSDCSLVELVVHAEKGLQTIRRLSESTPHPIQFIQPLPNRDSHIGVVDAVSGFRLLLLEPSKAVEEKFPSSDSSTAEACRTEQRKFSQFFNNPPGALEDGQGNSRGALEPWSTRDIGPANQWLRNVLQDAPYTAPPMSAVLSQYLHKRQNM